MIEAASQLLMYKYNNTMIYDQCLTWYLTESKSSIFLLLFLFCFLIIMNSPEYASC